MVVHDALNGDSVYAYVTDPLGTVRNVVNDTGTLANSYTYKAFGEVRGKTEGVSNPYLFTGRRWNSDIQEYYYRARNYMPDIGRFGAVDRYAPGEQTYGYAAMNPLMYRDPRGESVIVAAGVGLLTVFLMYTAYEGLVAAKDEGSNLVGAVESYSEGNSPRIKSEKITEYDLKNSPMRFMPSVGVPVAILSALGISTNYKWMDELILRDENGCEFVFLGENHMKIFNGIMAAQGLYQMLRALFSSLSTSSSIANAVDDTLDDAANVVDDAVNVVDDPVVKTWNDFRNDKGAIYIKKRSSKSLVKV